MVSLANHLDERKAHLVQRWIDRWPKERPVTESRAELRDEDVPLFFDGIITALSRSEAEDESSGPDSWRAQYRVGFELDAILRDYLYLRNIIFDSLEDHKIVPTLKETRVLMDFVATAIAKAVTEHTLQQKRREDETKDAHMKALEQALSAEKSLVGQLETVFTQSPAAMALWSHREMIFEKVNPEFASIFGHRDLLGKQLLEAVPELAEQEFPALLRGVFDTGDPVVGRGVLAKVIRTKGGPLEDRYFDFTYARINDAINEPYGVYCHAIDVTDKVLARQDLEASERQLKDLLAELSHSRENLLALTEAIPQQVWTAAADGGLDFVNQRVTEYFARAPEEMLGAGWQSFIHVDDLESVGARWAHSLATGEDYEVEFRLRRFDGEYRWHLARARAARDESGRPARWFGTNTDIDEAKRFREASEQAHAIELGLRRDAEAANRAKDDFLAMLGHELRNPLAPIATALQLMALRLGDTSLHERTIIDRQVKHMSRLVDDLLDVSRITSGKIELNRSHVEIATVIANAVEMVSPLLEQRRHHLTLDVPASGLTVNGDPVRLAQMVQNLVTNAAKYTELEGQIVIRAWRAENEVCISVKDTGVGITEEMLPRVFDLFAQEQQSLDRSRGGLGLGLAIVRTFATLHGGSIEAKSEGRGRGSEFILRLPSSLENRPKGEDANASKLPSSDARYRILVVDDNEDAAALLSLTLELKGHEVKVAHDGLQALQIVQTFTPQIAVLDIGLPVMDGYELARRLRELPALADTKFVALTGYGQASDHRRSAEANFFAHLVKPVQFAALESLIKDMSR